MNVFFHAKPLFVTNCYTTISPFVVVTAFFWITQGLLGTLETKNEKKI